MKSSFSACTSKFKILMALCALGTTALSSPAMAVSQEVCVKTSTGDVVCGTPVPKPRTNPNRGSDAAIATYRDLNVVTWELQSCVKEERNVVRCTLSLSTSQDLKYDIILKEGSGPNGGAKLVDSSGNEYSASRIQMGDKFAGGNDEFIFDMAQGSIYRITIDFANVPASISRATLWKVGTYASVGGWGGVKFRNVPIN